MDVNSVAKKCLHGAWSESLLEAYSPLAGEIISHASNFFYSNELPFFSIEIRNARVETSSWTAGIKVRLVFLKPSQRTLKQYT